MAHVEVTEYNPDLYTGRAEPYESSVAQYWYQHIKAFNSDQPKKIGLVGFASDQGVNRNQGRIGAKYAPDAIKAALAKLPVPLSIQKQGDKLTNLTNLVGDMGNVACVDDDTIVPEILESAQQTYANQITHVLAQHSLAIGLGGGHEIAYGSFMGLWHHLTQTEINLPTIGIINIDAHFDLRQDQYATSGTPFRQISELLAEQHQDFYYLCVGISQFANTAALFERAENLSVKTISDDDCHRLDWSAIEQQILNFIAPLEVIYLTIDMDALSGFVMPAVSAVAAKGLSLDFVERCVSLIIGTGKVKLIDMAEVSPTFDIDGRGLKVASRLLALMIEQVLTLTNP